jgi:hypothetical protein
VLSDLSATLKQQTSPPPSIHGVATVAAPSSLLSLGATAVLDLFSDPYDWIQQQQQQQQQGASSTPQPPQPLPQITQAVAAYSAQPFGSQSTSHHQHQPQQQQQQQQQQRQQPSTVLSTNRNPSSSSSRGGGGGVHLVIDSLSELLLRCNPWQVRDKTTLYHKSARAVPEAPFLIILKAAKAPWQQQWA